MTSPRSRPGYVFLISVLFLGAISLAATVSLLLLSWAAEQNGLTYAQASEALEMARGCADVAIQKLRSDLTYAGGDQLVLPHGTCTVLSVQGSGPSNRTVCTEGRAGPTTKRLKVSIRELFPTPVVASYEESLTTSACTSPVTFVPPPPGPPPPPPGSPGPSPPPTPPPPPPPPPPTPPPPPPPPPEPPPPPPPPPSPASSSSAGDCNPFTVAANGTVTTEEDMNITFQNLGAKIENQGGTHMPTFICRSENGGDYEPLFVGGGGDDCTGSNGNKYGDELLEDGTDTRTYTGVPASTSYVFKVHAYLKIGPSTWEHNATSTDGSSRVLILKKSDDIRANPNVGDPDVLLQFLAARGLLDGSELVDIAEPDLLLVTELNDAPGSGPADYDDDVLWIQGQQSLSCGSGA